MGTTVTRVRVRMGSTVTRVRVHMGSSVTRVRVGMGPTREYVFSRAQLRLGLFQTAWASLFQTYWAAIFQTSWALLFQTSWAFVFQTSWASPGLVKSQLMIWETWVGGMSSSDVDIRW